MEAHLCNHPLVPHTVEYALRTSSGQGASVSRPFEHLEDADIFAQKIIRQNTARLAWIKIFRSDNPAYACFVWENPKRINDFENQKVKLEVDMEPMAEAFDNIATGFKEQGASIKKLWVVQTAVIIALIVDVASRFF